MLLVVITFLLVAVGVGAYCYGAWKLSRYAARISGGLAAGVLLFPPVAFWFSFYKLEEEGKEFPTTMWLFGMVSTLLLIVVFWTPISFVLTGRMAELEKPSGVAETAVAEYGMKEGEENTATPTPPATESPAVEPNNAPAATNGAAATNAAAPAAGTNGAPGTNNAPAATNNAPATAAAAGTAAGAAQ